MAFAFMAFDETVSTPTGLTCLAGTKATDHVSGKIYMLAVNHQGAAIGRGQVCIHEAGYLRGERVDLGDACADGPVAGVVASGYASGGVSTAALFWLLRKGTISMDAGTQCASLAVGMRIIAASLNEGCFRDLPGVVAAAGTVAETAAVNTAINVAASAAIHQAGRVFGYVLAAGGGSLAAVESVFVNLEDGDVY